MKFTVDTERLEKIIEDLKEVGRKNDASLVEMVLATNMVTCRKFYQEKVEFHGKDIMETIKTLKERGDLNEETATELENQLVEPAGEA